MRKFNVILRRIYGSTTSEVEVEVPDDVEEDPKVWIRNQYLQGEMEISENECPDVVDEEFEIEEIESDITASELHPHSFAYLSAKHGFNRWFTHPGYKDLYGPSPVFPLGRTFFTPSGELKAVPTPESSGERIQVEPPEGLEFSRDGKGVIRKNGIIYGVRSGGVYTALPAPTRLPSPSSV